MRKLLFITLLLIALQPQLAWSQPTSDEKPATTPAETTEVKEKEAPKTEAAPKEAKPAEKKPEAKPKPTKKVKKMSSLKDPYPKAGEYNKGKARPTQSSVKKPKPKKTTKK